MAVPPTPLKTWGKRRTEGRRWTSEPRSRPNAGSRRPCWTGCLPTAGTRRRCARGGAYGRSRPICPWGSATPSPGWRGNSPRFFGADLDGVRLRADDLDWTFGTGTPLTGAAQDLLLLAYGRRMPPGTPARKAVRPFRRRVGTVTRFVTAPTVPRAAARVAAVCGTAARGIVTAQWSLASASVLKGVSSSVRPSRIFVAHSGSPSRARPTATRSNSSRSSLSNSPSISATPLP